MTVISYHSTIVSDGVSSLESPFTTSSQILLSRDIAEPSSVITPPNSPTTLIPVASFFESNTKHVMTVGNAATRIASEAAEEPLTSPGPKFTAADTAVIKSTPYSSKGSEMRLSTVEIADSIQSSTDKVSTPCALQVVLKDDEQRGRSPERSTKYPNPLARAESSRNRELAIVLDTTPIGKRVSRSSTFFEDPSDPCAILDDKILEPCPHIPLCSNVTEVLGDVLSDPDFSMHDVLRNQQADSPSQMVSYDELVQILHSNDHRNLSIQKLYCELPNGNGAIIKLSLAAQLPTEVLHQVFEHLSHIDFNSARHTCRSWFINSLEKGLLDTMLRRGGFSSSIQQEITNVLSIESSANIEWIMSKSLSRECALGPEWSGSGVACTANKQQNSAFIHTSTVDFTEIAVHNHQTKSAGMLFTVSSCGRFLMVANGCLVYIYELNKSHRLTEYNAPRQSGALLPVTSIICPSRVLGCSMDTSSQRYAIAILLDGRMGLVCEITALNSPTPRTGSDHESRSRSARESRDDTNRPALYRGTSFLDRISLNSSGASFGPEHQGIKSEARFVLPGIATNGALEDAFERQDVFRGDVPSSTQTAGPSSRNGSVPKFNELRKDSYPDTQPPGHTEDGLPSSIPIETGPRSLYRNLCSDDDPPRSVAICPQRRCVAFGCSSGIELHWVDALTGQDLNRWFPLTSPSDYLFFLPPRKSVDSAKKLRLISSAGGPNERTAIGMRRFGRRSRTSPFWDKLRWSSQHSDDGNELHESAEGFTRTGTRAGYESRGFSGRPDCSDHYRAIPLSDGYHILFTDPSSGYLCLGSDAPVGGPTKLLRKFWFQGPSGVGSPVIYTAGSDLRWGVRILAVFGEGAEQSIWMFSVPSDIFGCNQNSHPTPRSSIWIKPRKPRESLNVDWVDWWPQGALEETLSYTNDYLLGLSHHTLWPMRVRGQEIGKCTGVIDLAMDSGPIMTVWAFSNEGVAKVWKLDNGANFNLTNRWVVRDGTVREEDANGDIEMDDATLSSIQDSSGLHVQDTTPPPSLDGTMSRTPSMALFSAETRIGKRRRHRTRYDAEGDVIMNCYLSSSDLTDEEGYSFEEVVV